MGLGSGLCASGGLWTPGRLASLRAWLEPDSMVVTSGHVSGWADKGPLGLSLAQASGTRRPLHDTAHRLNGYVGALSDGVDDLLVGSAPNLVGTAYTFAAVLQTIAHDAGWMISTTGSDFAGGMAFLSPGEPDNHRAVIHANVGTGEDGTVTGAPELWIATFDGHTMRFYLNGVEQALSGAPASMIAPGAGGQLSVGQWAGSAAPANFRLWGFAVCNAALVGAEFDRFTRYWKGKYQL